MTKQRMAYSYEDAGNRHSIVIKEAKYGWMVTIVKNGVEQRKSREAGSLMTVMARAIAGDI